MPLCFGRQTTLLCPTPAAFYPVLGPDFGHLEIQVAVDDPKAYTKPWTVTENFNFLADTDLIENYCENEKDAAHLTGK